MVVSRAAAPGSETIIRSVTALRRILEPPDSVTACGIVTFWELAALDRLRSAPGSLAVMFGAEELLSRYRIVPTIAQRVAAADTPHRQDEPPRRPMFPDRLERVLGTRRIVLAPAGEAGRYDHLVEADEPDEESLRRVAEYLENSPRHSYARRSSMGAGTSDALRKTSSIFASTAFDPPVSSSSRSGVRAMRTKSIFPLKD